MFRQIGPPEIILILAVLVLLFGAKKLPELARGSGRALRIFKAETKGLIDDEQDAEKSDEGTPAGELETPGEQAASATSATSPEAERARDSAD